MGLPGGLPGGGPGEVRPPLGFLPAAFSGGGDTGGGVAARGGGAAFLGCTAGTGAGALASALGGGAPAEMYEDTWHILKDER